MKVKDMTTTRTPDQGPSAAAAALVTGYKVIDGVMWCTAHGDCADEPDFNDDICNAVAYDRVCDGTKDTDCVLVELLIKVRPEPHATPAMSDSESSS